MALRAAACRISAWLAAAPHLNPSPNNPVEAGHGICSVHGLWAAASCGQQTESVIRTFRMRLAFAWFIRLEDS